MIDASAAVATEITIPGPQGPLAGTYVDVGGKGPVVVIIPGSGPTDRDGNNPMGVKANYLKLLADDLAAYGFRTVRIDKRGMFASKAAIPDPNKVTIPAYATDARAWAKAAAKRAGTKCAWLAGHSEGGLVALFAAQQPKGICGVITIAAPGRRLSDVMREQLRANPFNAPILPPALKAIDELEAGRTVDAATLPAQIQPLFNAAVQPFVIDLFSHDPAKLATNLKIPILVVQGNRDLQVSMVDARRLADAKPGTRLAEIDKATHTLKVVESEDRAANMATYTSPDLPLAPGIAEAIAAFVKAKR